MTSNSKFFQATHIKLVQFHFLTKRDSKTDIHWAIGHHRCVGQHHCWGHRAEFSVPWGLFCPRASWSFSGKGRINGWVQSIKNFLEVPSLLGIPGYACQSSLITSICLPQSLSWSQVSTGHLQPVDFATLFWSLEGEINIIPGDSVTGLCFCVGGVHESLQESFLCSWGSREFVGKEHLWQERQYIANSETSQL